MVNCKNVLSRIFISSLPFLMCGCLFYSDREPTIYENGFFKYIHLGDNSGSQNLNDRSLVIVGFTDLGQEQETLDIPRKIDGYEVKRIGLKDSDFYHLSNRQIYPSQTLKKIYVEDNIEYIEEFMGSNVEIFLNSPKKFLKKFECNCKNIYLYKELFEELGYPELYSDPNVSRLYLPANVNFLINLPTSSENDLYRIDNISTGERIKQPVDPKIEGYDFKGWYTSPECLDKFNFETIPTLSEQDGIVLYAGWNIL